MSSKPVPSGARSDRRSEFLAVFLQHKAGLEAFIRAAVRDATTADDLGQELAMALWADFERYDSERPFGPWARGVASNILLRHWKKSRRTPVALSPEVIQKLRETYDRRGDTPSSRPAALEACMSKLPGKSLELIRLRYEQGFRLHEIALRVGTTEEGARKALARIRMKLQSCMGKHAKGSA